MIVRDEEALLARCLNSIRDVVDEIIIVDTGSKDGTKEIAKAYTDKIYDFKWEDDFAAARNFSFAKATKDYTLWLDADDIVSPQDRSAFMVLKETLDSNVDIVMMKYHLTPIGGHKIIASLDRERLVKTEREFRWVNPVHEYIACQGVSIKVDIGIIHQKIKLPTRRNLEIFEKYRAAGNILDQRSLFYYARELFKWGEAEKAMAYYEEFLQTTGEMASKYLDSCIDMSQYYEAKGDLANSLKSLIRFFEKEGPRAEICCKLGYYYKDRGDYEKAISWFKIAPYTYQSEYLGKIMHDYWHYIPYMELCACYYKLGKIDEAIQYNEEAAKYAPRDEKVLYNRCFLGNIQWQNAQR